MRVPQRRLPRGALPTALLMLAAAAGQAVAQAAAPAPQAAAEPPAPADSSAAGGSAASPSAPLATSTVGPHLPAAVRISFPGRQRTRTLVRLLIGVPRGAARPDETIDPPLFRFQLDGEVRWEGEIFETFRYRFEELLVASADQEIALLAERALRPGGYLLALELVDLVGGGVFRDQREITVPAVEGPVWPAGGEEGSGQDPRLDEADAAPGRGDVVVRLLPPPRELVTGRLRVDALASGEAVTKVAFRLDGKPLMAKNQPPYSVEIDVGKAPRMHALEAVAIDGEGAELARDEIVINGGAQAFSLRLLEPQPGARHLDSLRAIAEVDVPPGERLERVEFYRDETRVATQYQPPFTQPILLPGDGELAYVRAVAFLADGNSTEDAAFVNAPDFVDRIQVDLVELYVSVVDRKGRPVEDLAREELNVFERGTPQQVRRFERVRDLPIHAAVLLDTSISMLEELGEAEEGALRFFEQVLTPKDRAAVFSFDDEIRQLVPFTNRLDRLAGGLAELEAGGDTALHDAIIHALYAFGGLKGKRALILLSDGEDSHSRFRFEEALEYARHAGVAIYCIGLDVLHKSVEARAKLERLAAETGGGAFYITAASELGRIYELIQREFRSQYLVAYQSSDPTADGAFRPVEVALERDGLKATTIRGYYP